MKHNRDKLFQMIEYIKSKDRIVEPLELIAYFVPSVYELNLVYNKTYKGAYYNIRIDMQCKKLKNVIRKAYELKDSEFTSDMIYNYLKES